MKNEQPLSEGSVRIGDWLLEPEVNRLSRDGCEEQLEARAVDVLLHLASNAPRTVSAEELLDLFWTGRVVESSTVHRTISKIRRALGDEPNSPSYIQTVPKRGYRVVAEVQLVAASEDPPPANESLATEVLTLPTQTAALIEESSLLGLGRVEITRGLFKIGRGKHCDLTLADKSISKNHAWIVRDSGDWVIRDLNSTNGISVNDRFVESETLEHGDLIEIGRVKLRFESE